MRLKSILIILFSSFSLLIIAQPASDKLIRKGVSLHDKGKYNDAIHYYEQALKLNPSSMSATYEMSLSYLYLKDYDKALKLSTKVINSNFQPLLVDAYCVKSSALADMNKTDQAIKLLNEGLSRCGDQYLLHYNLGLSYFKGRNLNSAIYHLQKAIEIDTTQPSAFLLYAYALSDSDRWVQSFLAFHFFLLLEPNTDRSKDAFGEMYDLIARKIEPNSASLTMEDGIDRKKLYDQIIKLQPKIDDPRFEYAFFVEASRQIFFTLSQLQDDSRTGLLWDFYVPTDTEILQSGYFETYCRYISVSYFPASLDWWNTHKFEVDQFILWFEGSGDTSDGADDDIE